MEGRMECLKCKKTFDNTPDKAYSFCSTCGEPLSVKGVPCPKCMKTLYGRYEFCPNCGQNVSTLSKTGRARIAAKGLLGALGGWGVFLVICVVFGTIVGVIVILVSSMLGIKIF